MANISCVPFHFKTRFTDSGIIFPIKKVMMYCFFSYLITSFCFLMLFLDATYNSTGTFPSSIALISSRSLPVMDAMFSGDIPLWFILIMIFASPSDSPSFLASSRSSFISSLNASHIFASLFPFWFSLLNLFLSL